MSEPYDIAVVGSGFAGTFFAMIARRLGRSVVLLEGGRHPRFAIGESSTPLSNLLLEELAQRYDLPALRPLAKWGSWQAAYPEVACGLKRGFSFFHHERGAGAGAATLANQMLVAASPHDAIADTHWFRAESDALLVRQAVEIGAAYVDEVRLERFVDEDEGDAVLLEGRKDGKTMQIRARFVVDATGPRGFLHRVLGVGEVELPEYPRTCALYSHFSGVKRLDALPGSAAFEAAPYPADDAAVHHVFEGGWVWVLRFNNGITSAGVAATEVCADGLGLREGAAGWQRLLDEVPALAGQFCDARAEQPFVYVPQLSFRSAAVYGRRWAMLPAAAGFVDPLLSTGFALSLLGVSRLAELVDRHWRTAEFARGLERYAVETDGELLATARLIGALCGTMGNFRVFRSLVLLYFAAASYSETVRRLGRPEQARSFLLHDHPVFGDACRRLLLRVQAGVRPEEAEEIAREVERLIEPIDVAGLCKRPGNGWYPVEAEDLLDAAAKVGSTREELAEMLRRSGFYA